MRVQLTFAELFGTTTGTDIHCCTDAPGAGLAGSATQAPSLPGFPRGAASGSLDRT